MRRTEGPKSQRYLLALAPPTPAEVRYLATTRPRTRGDCVDGPRPCVRCSCRHHLGIEVTRGSSIRYPIGNLQPWEVPETCALDIADRGDELTADQVAQILGYSRQAILVIERVALLKLRSALEEIEAQRECEVCGLAAEAWISGCSQHAREFALSRVGALVAVQRVTLAKAWDRWVESRAS